MVLRHTCAARGFSLIELMIAVAVVALLAAVALPTFNDSIRKGRRSEAFAALAQVQQAQERWRTNHSNYADNSQLSLPVVPANSGDPVGLGVPGTTGSGYYTITIGSSPTGTSYVTTATAVAGTSQAADAGCQVLAAKMDGGTVLYASGVSSVDFTAANKDPKGCWAR
ncbi:MAG: type IV pilin protein [Rubrivivax sp.]